MGMSSVKTQPAFAAGFDEVAMPSLARRSALKWPRVASLLKICAVARTER